MRPRGWVRLAAPLACVAVALLAAGCLASTPAVEAVDILPASLDTNSVPTARVVERAGGAELTYQWMKNGHDIKGATGASLDLSVAGHGDRGDTVAVRIGTRGKLPFLEATTSTPVPIAPAVTLNVTETKKFYRLSGTDSESLFASIRNNGPHEGGKLASGLTQFDLTWKLAATQLGSRCSIDDLTLLETIVITLPEIEPAVRSPQLVAKIERFRSAVVIHEDRHVSIRRAHLDRAVAALKAIEPTPTCAELEREIAATLALDEETRAQEAFHAKEDIRLKAVCAPISAQMTTTEATLASLRSQPARYNALVPTYNGLVDDYNWCVKS